MKLGKNKVFFLVIFFTFLIQKLPAEDKILSAPLLNLEKLKPSFEEIDQTNSDEINNDVILNTKNKNNVNKNSSTVRLIGLDKITAKTLAIKLGIGEKKYFGSLEIKALKCQLSENNEFSDAVAYLQVKDLDAKDNNQVFLFNGWTFASSPTLESIDHPIYDLWITGCENI